MISFQRAFSSIRFDTNAQTSLKNRPLYKETSLVCMQATWGWVNTSTPCQQVNQGNIKYLITISKQKMKVARWFYFVAVY